MKSSLLEVIDMVLQRIEDSAQTAENESSIRVWLAGQGYSRRDIDAAMRIVFPRGGEASRRRKPLGVCALVDIQSMDHWVRVSGVIKSALEALERLAVLTRAQ